MDTLLKTELEKACAVLRAGGVILYPTDTVWGIGCDATNEEAVRRIYEIKRRPDRKAMLILLDDPGKIASYARMPDIALDLIEIADKPLTIVYPGARGLAPSLIGEDNSIGIRITKEAFSQNLVRMLRKPIVSTSANISGRPAPSNYDEIDEAVRSEVDYIVECLRENKGKTVPSSIIKLEEDGSFKILRP